MDINELTVVYYDIIDIRETADACNDCLQSDRQRLGYLMSFVEERAVAKLDTGVWQIFTEDAALAEKASHAGI